MHMPEALRRGLSAVVLVAAFAPLPTLGLAQAASAAPARFDRAEAEPARRPPGDARIITTGSNNAPPSKSAAAARAARSCHHCDLVAATSLLRASMTGLIEAPE